MHTFFFLLQRMTVVEKMHTNQIPVQYADRRGVEMYHSICHVSRVSHHLDVLQSYKASLQKQIDNSPTPNVFSTPRVLIFRKEVHCTSALCRTIGKSRVLDQHMQVRVWLNEECAAMLGELQWATVVKCKSNQLKAGRRFKYGVSAGWVHLTCKDRKVGIKVTVRWDGRERNVV